MKKFNSFSLLIFLIFIIKIVHSECLNGECEGRCGKGYGSCKKGECCSKYGWCGKSDKYCGKGCQSEFGKCKSMSHTITTTSTTTTKTSTQSTSTGKCGEGYGSCKEGECCSKYGWCGKSDKYCGKGCQSEFGKCKSMSHTITTTSTTKTKTSTQSTSTGKCGEGYGSCKEGECCSKYGWCGKSDKYCGKGCQSEFGKCESTSQTITTTSTTTTATSTTTTTTSTTTTTTSTQTTPTGSNECQSEFGDCNNNNEHNSTVISNPNFDFSFLKMENDKKNMIYSPMSIKYALYMLKEGANGNSYDEINNVVGNEELSKYTSNDKNLSLANGLFIRNTYYEFVKESFTNTLKKNYDAEIVKDEFKDAQNVNKWIEDKTLGIIKNMLKDEMVQNPNNKMLIINALAIDMEWSYKFEFEDTIEETFYMDNGQEMKATTMSMRNVFNKNISFYINDDITVLTMNLKNYNGIQFEFMAIMPNENLSEYIKNISKEKIDQIDKKLKLSSDEEGGVNVFIPKFKFDYDLKLKEDLINLGIKDVFDGAKADLSKIVDNKKQLYVSDALHKSNIEFSEKGVKAAAVSIFLIIEGMDFYEVEPVDIIINKPFMFIIRDKNTKDIWFTGTVYEPNSWEKDEENYYIKPWEGDEVTSVPSYEYEY